MRFLSFYTIVAAVALSVTFAHAAGPTGLLNDTGLTQCYDAAYAWVACDAATTGDAGTFPRQDGRFGRDVASAAKVGGGAAGFDFTPLDADGNAIPLTGTPAVPVSRPTCVHDNVTNLDWEVKTAGVSGLHDWDNTYSWYDSNIATNGGFAGIQNDGTGTCSGPGHCDTEKFVADVNAERPGFCGTANPNRWRLPTRRELLSIVHNGIDARTIDADYFPYTQSDWYWTSDTYVLAPTAAWRVSFLKGDSFVGPKNTTPYYVRLVRSGQ